MFCPVAVEDGTSLTITLRGEGSEANGWQGEFESARRVWLGHTPGVEWLHDEALRRLGPDVSEGLYVNSTRQTAYIGAAGEIATVVVEIVGAGSPERSSPTSSTTPENASARASAKTGGKDCRTSRASRRSDEGGACRDR
jgi:hypothetical protein